MKQAAAAFGATAAPTQMHMRKNKGPTCAAKVLEKKFSYYHHCDSLTTIWLVILVTLWHIEPELWPSRLAQWYCCNCHRRFIFFTYIHTPFFFRRLSCLVLFNRSLELVTGMILVIHCHCHRHFLFRLPAKKHHCSGHGHSHGHCHRVSILATHPDGHGHVTHVSKVSRCFIVLSSNSNWSPGDRIRTPTASKMRTPVPRALRVRVD